MPVHADTTGQWHVAVLNQDVFLPSEREEYASRGLSLDIAGQGSLQARIAAFRSGLLPHQFNNIW